jgi:steroid delta-isomerase-like uncharacterized protein
MRAVACAAFAALALAGCSRLEAPAATAAPVAAAPAAPVTAPAPSVAPAPTTVLVGGVAQSRAVLDAWLEAMNQHDEARAAALLAGDAQVFDALLANVFQGREVARREVIAMYLRAVPDGQWSLRGEPVVSAEGFAYEWVLTGTNQGNWTNYLRGRGQRIDFKGATFVRLREGRIAYQATYFDTNALGAQVGW